jgi:16S rRNA (cytosine1402-N4)-methyltransferase
VAEPSRHVPILLEPIVSALIAPFAALPSGAPPHWILDCTLGGGGHTGALLRALPSPHRVLAIDRDSGAIARARETFARELASSRLELAHASISEAEPILEGKPLLGVLADLGFSSDQVDDAGRGLSFQAEGPLDMRLDPSRGLTARQYLAQASEKELADVLHHYGEERFARRIASAILLARRESRLPDTTKELSELVVRALPAGARHGKIHAATRTFQALRIQVNDELNELDCLLKRVILNLKPGGRVAVLSFHSLEDRRVKHALKPELSFRPLAKKPIEAGPDEIARNPRARSAKLRIAEKTG